MLPACAKMDLQKPVALDNLVMSLVLSSNLWHLPCPFQLHRHLRRVMHSTWTKLPLLQKAEHMPDTHREVVQNVL